MRYKQQKRKKYDASGFKNVVTKFVKQKHIVEVIQMMKGNDEYGVM